MKPLVKAGKTFEIPRLGRAQLREMRKKGFDLIQKAFKLGGKDGEIPITGDELDTLLEVAFPGRDADLDFIGLSGQVELGSMVISEAFESAEEIKN
jgi:hypothetical protein